MDIVVPGIVDVHVDDRISMFSLISINRVLKFVVLKEGGEEKLRFFV